jgi:hypothetical protein
MDRLTSAELLDYLQRPILMVHPNRAAYSIRWRPKSAGSLENVFSAPANLYEVRGPYGVAAHHLHRWVGSEDIFLPLVSDPDDSPPEEVTAAAQDAFDLFLAWQEETEEL